MLWSRNDSQSIAEMFMTIFERELGDAGFVEVAEAFIAVTQPRSLCATEFSMSRSPTSIALRARTNLQVRNPPKIKALFRRQNHPRHSFPCRLIPSLEGQSNYRPNDHFCGLQLAVTMIRPLVT
jgi:hypothetical protein